METGCPVVEVEVDRGGIVADVGPSAKLLANGSTKKGTSVWSFSMAFPWRRCQFASDTCNAECYAKVGRFPLVEPTHQRNYRIACEDGFEERIGLEVSDLAWRHPDQRVAVCLHERGEFFSMPYVRQWRRIILGARCYPNMSVYIYTRAWVSPEYRAELDLMAKRCPNLRINLSLDGEMIRKHGLPERIGDGLLTYLAVTDEDLPHPGVDLVVRNLRIRNHAPMERLGGVRVCPNESGLYVAKETDRPIVRNGRNLRIRCQDCRLCIDRSFEQWDKAKSNYAGPPGAPVLYEANSTGREDVCVRKTTIDVGPDHNATTPKTPPPRTLPASTGRTEDVTYTVMSLFSGCGGMDLGFEQEGFDVVAACEWDPRHPDTAETYATNHPTTNLVNADIRLTETKERLMASFTGKHCDVLIGGPPCVASSTSGKRDPSDPRGWLFRQMISVADMCRPYIAVLEQVPGALSCRHGEVVPLITHIVAGFEDIGYRVEYRVIHAANLGVPQCRRRVIVVATRLDVPVRFPLPTHTDGSSLFDDLLPWVSAHDAICDLEDAPESQSFSQVYVRSSQEFTDRIRRTVPGESATPNGFRDAFKRLRANRPSVTIKAGSGVPVHYSRDRLITPREMARLQTFDDSFKFVGPPTGAKLMIGNAVPPLMARAVAVSVREMLDEHRCSVSANG